LYDSRTIITFPHDDPFPLDLCHSSLVVIAASIPTETLLEPESNTLAHQSPLFELLKHMDGYKATEEGMDLKDGFDGG